MGRAMVVERCATCGSPKTRSKREWIQVNAALTANAEGRVLTSARRLFSRLEQVVGNGKRRVGRYFFMRKPPGIRVRVLPKAGDVSVPSELTALFRRARREGIVDRWHFARYEPEFRLFGGEAAMRAVHTYFEADSHGWWSADTAWCVEGGTPSLASLSERILNDLFLRVVDGPEETWDIWCNLATLHAGSDVRPARPIHTLDCTDDELTPAQVAVMGHYASANARLSHALRTLAARGCLTSGVRGIAAFVAMFHWNRFGLSALERASILGPMLAAFDPAREMRGVYE